MWVRCASALPLLEHRRTSGLLVGSIIRVNIEARSPRSHQLDIIVSRSDARFAAQTTRPVRSHQLQRTALWRYSAVRVSSMSGGVGGQPCATSASLGQVGRSSRRNCRRGDRTQARGWGCSRAAVISARRSSSSAGEHAIVAPEPMLCVEPSASTTSAPASRAITTPAAVSHGWFDNMMLASSRPAATQARSMAAEPNIRTRCTRFVSCSVTASRATFLAVLSTPTA